MRTTGYRTLLLLCGGWGIVGGLLLAAGDAGGEWLSGKKLEWALDQPVVATWQNAQIRTAVQALSDQRRVPIVFDRRLDPNRMFSLVTRGESLSEVWPQLGKIAGASISNTGQTIYLGPPGAAGKLRTLIALRQGEIDKLDLKKLPPELRKLATLKNPVRWEDLDSPRDILQRLATERDVQITGLELIPHDLWGATELPPISLVEAASLVLIQFDLTFRMEIANKALTLELIPVPDNVVIQRQWPMPRSKADTILKSIHSELPDAQTELVRDQLKAQGTAEQLAELDRIIHSATGSGTTARKKPPAAAPLSQRKLTFQAKDAPVAAILEKISETGIQFEYDRATMKAAGIDMDQLVGLDVKAVAPEKLFETLFTPLKIAYEVDGLTVKLRPGK